MPKTKDAFALKIVYNTFCGQLNSSDWYEQVDSVYCHLMEKGLNLKPIPYNVLTDIERGIVYCQYGVRRAIFLTDITEHHIRRLTKLLSSMATRIVEGNNEPTFSKKLLRAKDLIQKYQNLMDCFKSSIESSNRFLQGHYKTLKLQVQSEFGERLRIARKKAGYTQVQTAQFLSITQISYSQYETGRTAPPLSTIWLLARKFNVSADWLLALSE